MESEMELVTSRWPKEDEDIHEGSMCLPIEK